MTTIDLDKQLASDTALRNLAGALRHGATARAVKRNEFSIPIDAARNIVRQLINAVAAVDNEVHGPIHGALAVTGKVEVYPTSPELGSSVVEALQLLCKLKDAEATRIVNIANSILESRGWRVSLLTPSFGDENHRLLIEVIEP